MSASVEFYSGVRPSDLRFDNYHLLAEYIAQAQRLVDSAAATQRESDRLLTESTKVAQHGVVEFRAAGERLAGQSRRLESTLAAAVRQEATNLAQRVADAQTSGALAIMQASEIASRRFKAVATQADELKQAAARLEAAAEQAATECQRSEKALASLNSYRAELLRFEAESMARIRQAKALLYRGASLWSRIVFVLRPQSPQLRELKAPGRPGALGGGMRSQSRP